MTTDKPRLVTYISDALDQRLRTTAAVRRQRMTQALEDALDKGLPTADELATAIKSGSTSHDE